jgi:hypothetical protein
MQKTSKRARRGQKPAQLSVDEMMQRIRDNLVLFGGEAHRRDVIEAVARDVGVNVLSIPQDLESAVIHSFEEAWRDEQKRQTYGFTLRFGEGSHRWGVRIAS